MSDLSETDLPPVNGLLKDDLLLSLLDSDRNYNDQEKGSILFNVFNQVFQNLRWGWVLDPAFEKLENCVKAVGDNVNLANCIGDCIKNRDWKPLFKHHRWFHILLMSYHLYLLNGFRSPTSRLWIRLLSCALFHGRVWQPLTHPYRFQKKCLKRNTLPKFSYLPWPLSLSQCQWSGALRDLKLCR